MIVAVTLAIIFGLLVLSEILWRQKILRGEEARKLVHILVGTFIAFWPYIMNWRQIQGLSFGLLVVVTCSQYLTIFHAVHGVQRKTWGEIFFAVGVGLAALLQPPPLVFTAAILHLALADGFAALVGKRYGLLHQYRVGNYTKTLPGTFTFWLISTLIILATVLASRATLAWPLLPVVVVLPLAATLTESLGVMGTDNIGVPLLIIVSLHLLRVT